ncbi:MAG: BCCT family transporter [Phycisphaerales bacterium]|nr:MAG: BCCT family transporter [Phycisphaerales bacterium]
MRESRAVFIISASLIAIFLIVAIVLGLTTGDAMGDALGNAQNFVVDQFGWFYIISVGFFLLFVLVLLVSPYSQTRLGKDDDEPEFSSLTWFAMLFSAGMGIGLIFFSVAEPMWHFSNPPRDMEPGTIEAANQAMTLTFFHWGLHAWAIYIIVGMALAYFAYRHDLPLSIRSTLYPLLGERIHGPIGITVDVMAIVGTIFGVATSLGIGASQIAAGLEYLGLITLPAEDSGAIPLAEIVIIIVVTLIATISVATGVKVGIRRLSEANIVLGILLLLFVFIAGPTVFLLSSFVQSIGGYLQSLIDLTFRTDAFRGTDWQQDWTMFYWAWWISWSPFVGMFIARVSRGRTIREFILGVLLVPTAFAFFWIVVFGNSGIWVELQYIAAGGEAGSGVVGSASFSTALFAMLSQLPWSAITATIAIIVITTYFVTSSDSASLVIDILAFNGREETPVATRVTWALAEGAIAASLLLVGGLHALRSGAILTALPFCAIMLFICWSLFVALRRERHWVESRRRVRRQRRDMRVNELLEELDMEVDEDSKSIAEAMPRTGAATIGIDPSEVEGERGSSASWRDRLRAILKQSESRGVASTQTDLERIRDQVNTLLDDTVIPAFKQIREELKSHGREVKIEKHPYQAVLTVLKGGKEEFSYAVRGRAYHKLSFAFPQFDDRDESRILRAEVVLPSGPRPDYKAQQFSQEGIIQDFLSEYAKWRGMPL